MPAPVLKQTSWSSFEENTTQNQSAETLLKALKNVQQSMYTVEVIFLLSSQQRMAMTSCFVYTVIRDL